MKHINWKAMFTKQVLMVLFDIIAVNLSYVVAQATSVMLGIEQAGLTDVWVRIFAERALPVTIVFFLLF